MKIALSENIRTLRRQQGMMQEQLAEVMGVSVGAVSKWERGMAVPDLQYIVEMADLFGVSVDALLGVELHCSTIRETEQRIQRLQREKRYEEASVEAEKALTRFPHDFRIALCCGKMYQTKGMELHDNKAMERAVALLTQALALISQSTNPESSELSIWQTIAECYLCMGREEEGIRILRDHNAGGVFNALIGYTYSSSKKLPKEEAFPYLLAACSEIMAQTIRAMSGYANVYDHLGDHQAAAQVMLWLIEYLQSLKQEAAQICYVDKVIALFYADCADHFRRLGDLVRADAYLQLAYESAALFDRAPVYDMKGMKFCVTDVGHPATAYDNLGMTALEAVNNYIYDPEQTRDPGTIKRWEEIKRGNL